MATNEAFLTFYFYYKNILLNPLSFLWAFLYKSSSYSYQLTLPYSVLHIGANNTPVKSMQLGWCKDITKMLQNPQPLTSLFKEKCIPSKKDQRKETQRMLKRNGVSQVFFIKDVIVVWKALRMTMISLPQLEIQERSEVNYSKISILESINFCCEWSLSNWNE